MACTKLSFPQGFCSVQVGLPPIKLYYESEKHQFVCLFAVVDLNLLKEEVRLYSCTPRNFSVSLREELKRTDTIFWPLCLLVKRCGGNCACCHQSCNECQCVPTKVTKKYHEVCTFFFFFTFACLEILKAK